MMTRSACRRACCQAPDLAPEAATSLTPRLAASRPNGTVSCRVLNASDQTCALDRERCVCMEGALGGGSEGARNKEAAKTSSRDFPQDLDLPNVARCF